MALPTSRAEFKDYILRRNGYPVLQINATDDQIDDCINLAVQYFFDWHFDGTERAYYKYQVQDADVANRYITLPDNVIGAIHVFPPGDALSTNNMFNIRYQIALNDLYDLTSVSMVPYYQSMQNIQFMEEILVGQVPIRYNRKTNQLHLDCNWDLIVTGSYLVVECFQIVDVDMYTRVWSDRWLLQYAEQLVKQQQGTNLSKFVGVTMPGGVQFSGKEMYNDATAELRRLEDLMKNEYSLPPIDFMG